MPSTTLTEFTGSIDAIAARTTSTGTGVSPDWSAEERRIAHQLFGAGVALPASTGFQVVKGGGGTMNLIVGSGSAKADIAFVAGITAGQGKYLVRLDETTKTVTLAAANPSNPRIDEVYLLVSDNLYDSSSRSLPRFAVRQGDPAGTPANPGADAAWKAYLLLARVTVPAAAADILATTVSDQRVWSTLSTNADHGTATGLGDDDHTQYYNAARHTKAIHDALGIDHGSLTGMTDDDHTIYAKKAGDTLTGVLAPGSDDAIDLGNTTNRFRRLHAHEIYNGSAALTVDLDVRTLDGGSWKVDGDLDPKVDVSYDLGSSGLAWSRLYIGALYDENDVARMDLSESTLIGTWNVSGPVLPTVNNAYELGSSTFSWQAVYSYAQYDENGVARVDWSGPYLIGSWLISGPGTTTDNGLPSWRHWNAGSPYALVPLISSARYKKNIHDANLENLVEIFDQVQLREWQEKKTMIPQATDKWIRGVVAEEVYEYYPEAVGMDEDNKPLSVDPTTAFFLPMMAKVKQIEERVVALES